MMIPGNSRMLALALIAVLSGCSRDQPAREAPASARVTPEIASQDSPAAQQDEHLTLDAELETGDGSTRYQAHFSQTQLLRIDESRTRGAGTQAGSYEFYGARLVKYDGAGLTSDAQVQLEMDPQGRVAKALAGGQSASAEEITAIRERAQLLRSHALTQRATRSHAGADPATSAH